MRISKSTRRNSGFSPAPRSLPAGRTFGSLAPPSLRFSFSSLGSYHPVQRKEAVPNGLPSNLRHGIESLSGMPMHDVRVHRNSAKPAHIGASAYAQGRDIHLAQGQEQHLAHEAWHIVQQRQGRVRPMFQTKGVSINDDRGLESEADKMGSKALSYTAKSTI